NTEPELLAVTLFVSDVPASVAFYSALGITFDSDLHGGVGQAVIGLHPSSPSWPTTHTALSLTVPDLRTATAALTDIGAPWEPTPGMNGAVIAASDPDGNRVLIAQKVV
ncbi:MAG: VOC family protein, partial [Gordonia amarae]